MPKVTHQVPGRGRSRTLGSCQCCMMLIVPHEKKKPIVFFQNRFNFKILINQRQTLRFIHTRDAGLLRLQLGEGRLRAGLGPPWPTSGVA